MSLAIRLLCEPLRSLGFASIGAAYIGIGTAIISAARILHIQNLTDKTLLFSFDGINDHFPLAANGYLLLDITSNKTVPQGFFLPEGQRIYVKESAAGAPIAGSVYVTIFYGADL